MRKTTKMIVGVVAALAISAGSVMAGGHLNKIGERQEAMKAVGGGIKVLVGMAKGEIDFDAAKVKKAALTIKANLNASKTMFPDGTGPDSGKKTRAMDEIWLDTEGFQSALKTAISAADGMAGVTKKADLMPALGKLGGSCKSCHEKFRAPKK